jgi:TIR domain
MHYWAYMAAFKRLAAYLLVFVVLFAGFQQTGLWHTIDYAVYRALYLSSGDEVKLHDKLLLIDLPYKADRNDPTEFRQRLADLLLQIASREPERPESVILDIVIRSDDRGLKELEDAIKKLKHVPVYAAFDPEAGAREAPRVAQPWDLHAQDFYVNVLKGYGHTLLDLFDGVLSYEMELQVPNSSPIWALPAQVASDRGAYARPPPGKYVLRVGNEAEFKRHGVAFVHGNGTSGGKFFPSREDTHAELTPSLDRKIVIVGSVKEDVDEQLPQAGPKLVAWALSNELTKDANNRQPLVSPALVFGQILFLALFTVFVFALLFKYVKRLQTRPLIIACLSIGVSTLGLATTAAALLILDRVTPVGLALFAIVLSGILAWRFALKFLVMGVAEGSGKYDVFISYSHGHSDWVVKNVYEPLNATRKSDGSELSIFFDTAKIGLGEAFTAKYMWAIVDSRVFIPIFSEEYYKKNHCRNEMDVAYKRSIERRIVIVPVSLGAEAVPEIYSHLNYVDARANPQFIEDVKKTLLAPESVATA